MSTPSACVISFGRDTAVRELLRPLEPYFAMKDVTEIVVNRPREVLLEAGGQWHTVSLADLDEDRLLALARAVATYSDQDIGPRCPILSAILPGGQRIQIVVPPAVPAETISLSIRLPARLIPTLEMYERDGAFDGFRWLSTCGPDASDLGPADANLAQALASQDLVGFLKMAVRARRTIAVVGDTSSGKTTLMKTLCQHIPRDERIITIEDVRELLLPDHPNRVHLLYGRTGQSVAEVTPSDLIASCLRMRPDRVLLAELRGSEAFDFLKLLTTGHSGSITSFHAESCALAIERYVLMAKEHADAAIFDLAGLKHLVRLTLDVILHMRAETTILGDGTLGRRRVVDAVWYDPGAKPAPYERIWS